MSETRRWQISIVGQGEADPRSLKRHPLNPKVHTAAQDAVVEASLREFGWLKRVMVNEVTGHVLDGDERVTLAIERGDPTVPYDLVRVPADREGTVLRMLDQSAALAEVHLERWAQLQAQERTTEPALEAFFAAQAQQYGLSAPGGVPDAPVPDTSRVPGGSPGVEAVQEVVERGAQLRQEWATAPGQLWGCGPHRVYCGDSSSPRAWELLRTHVGEVQGCITSPPYAEQRARDYGGVPASGYVAWMRPIVGHLWDSLALTGSFFLNLKEHSEDILRPVYVHALVVALVTEDGWQYLDEFCWEKPGVPGDPVERGKFKNQWEPVFWFSKQARPVFHPERVRHRSEKALIDDAYQPGLETAQGRGYDFLGPKGRRGPGWAYPGNRLPSFGMAAASGHPATFPLGLPRFFVDVYSDPGDWWVDPFGGSGSTMMACQELGRQCWLIERSPAYIAVTLERFRQATGEQPERLA